MKIIIKINKINNLLLFFIVFVIVQGLRPEGIMVFASQLHTHLSGFKVVTKHFRGGVELPELNRDDHYNSNFQEIRILPKPVHVLPVSTSLKNFLSPSIHEPCFGQSQLTLLIKLFSFFSQMC